MRLNLPTLFSDSRGKDISGRKAAFVALAVLGAVPFAAGVVAGMYPLVYAGALVGLFALAKLKP
jgi:hypothetical protein